MMPHEMHWFPLKNDIDAGLCKQTYPIELHNKYFVSDPSCLPQEEAFSAENSQIQIQDSFLKARMKRTDHHPSAL